MAIEPRQNAGSSSRAVDLAGDSPELVAFALLRYLAQIERQIPAPNRPTFDRKWMLDAYSECLEAAKGQRKVVGRAVASPARPSRKPAG
jgi:hypothetical protein